MWHVSFETSEWFKGNNTFLPFVIDFLMFSSVTKCFIFFSSWWKMLWDFSVCLNGNAVSEIPVNFIYSLFDTIKIVSRGTNTQTVKKKNNNNNRKNVWTGSYEGPLMDRRGHGGHRTESHTSNMYLYIMC